MGEGTRLHHAMIEVCHNLGFEPKISVETDDPYYVRRYVDIGIGVAIVPSVSWHNMFSDNVALINVCDFNRSTYVYYKKNKSMSRTVNEFLSFLKSAFKNESAKVDKT
jgi:DNA-binding transcriptional LysR family regulator